MFALHLRSRPADPENRVMAKKENGVLGEVIGNAGFALDVFKCIAHAVIDHGGDIQNFRD